MAVHPDTILYKQAIFAVWVLLASSTAAQGDFRTDALAEHNKFRRIHQAPALTLDSSLNQQAQAYAEQLARTGMGLAHSDAGSRPNQGENLAAGYGFNYTIMTAVNSFYKESQLYNYSRPGFSSSTGHFTQVVWKASLKLGVGQAYNATSKLRNYQVFRYNPPGNYINLFKDNVLPPSKA